jgi:hypothetical protein
MERYMDLILQWSENFVEVKNRNFGNLPVCPFARKERLKRKILFVKTDITNLSTVESIAKFNNFNRFSTIIAYDEKPKNSVEEAKLFEDEFNEANDNLWLVYIHPKDPFNVRGTKTRRAPCPLVIITTREAVEKGEQWLWSTRYFDKWSKKNLDDLKVDPKD